MPPTHRTWVAFAAVLLALAAHLAWPPPAAANWLTKIAREAGETGTKVGKLGLGAIDNAASHIKALPHVEKGAALAAHATPEGHWQFVNRSGEVYTAGTPAEMGRFVSTLAPEFAKSGEGRLALYLSEDTVFAQRAALKDLPKDADLHLVFGKDAFPLLRRGDDKLYAEIRPNVIAELADHNLFAEAAFQLARPLNKSNIRVLALEPGGPERISSAPRIDPATKSADIDRIDPAKLASGLLSIRGQTAVVTGRTDGAYLRYNPAVGGEQAIPLKDLAAAAEAADVNLVILQSSAPRQPGGRNWLWQKVEVAGLDDALKRATFADFLDALGANLGELSVTAAPHSSGRIVLRATPTGSSAAPVSTTIGNWLSEITSNITGHVVTSAVEVYANDKERQSELDLRLIPFLPSFVQFAVLTGWIFALLGLAVTRSWWARIWPPEQREDYGGAIGYYAANFVRLLAFVLLFMPLAGLPAFLVSIMLQAWWFLTAPVRFIRWLFSRPRPQAG